jgi:hypothetical protein
MDAFYHHTFDLIESMEDCLSKGRILPCLTLLYSGIDVMSSLEASSNQNVKDRFTKWVDSYLLTAGSFRFNAVDLYAARCAVLHSFTAHSGLSRAGTARKLQYAWGTTDDARIDEASHRLGITDYVCVHVRSLIDAFRAAVADYHAELEAAPERMKRVERAAGLWFEKMSPDEMNELLHLNPQWSRRVFLHKYP